MDHLKGMRHLRNMNNLRVYTLIVLLFSSFFSTSPILTKETENKSEDHVGVGNGGFAFDASRELLSQAIRQLTPLLSSIDLDLFTQYPSKRELAIKLLKQLKINPYSPPRYRNGKLLMLDYSLVPPYIEILNPFFTAFAGTADEEFPVKLKAVKRLLLHEIAHIILSKQPENQKEAREFALKVIPVVRQQVYIKIGNCDNHSRLNPDNRHQSIRIQENTIELCYSDKNADKGNVFRLIETFSHDNDIILKLDPDPNKNEHCEVEINPFDPSNPNSVFIIRRKETIFRVEKIQCKFCPVTKEFLDVQTLTALENLLHSIKYLNSTGTCLFHKQKCFINSTMNDNQELSYSIYIGKHKTKLKIYSLRTSSQLIRVLSEMNICI